MATKFRLWNTITFKAERTVFSQFQKLYGVGPWESKKICATLGIRPSMKIQELDEDFPRVQRFLETHYKDRDLAMAPLRAHMQTLTSTGSRRARRHMQGLVVNGQNMKTNGGVQRQEAVKRAKQMGYPLIPRPVR